MSIHTSGLVPRRLFSARCELVPSTSVSCRPRQGVGYSLKWQGQGIGCKPVGATHVVGLWRVRARGRGRSIESPLAGLGELPNSRSRRPACDFPFRWSSAESMGRKLRSIDGGGLSSLACRSPGPARSTARRSLMCTVASAPGGAIAAGGCWCWLFSLSRPGTRVRSLISIATERRDCDDQ